MSIDDPGVESPAKRGSYAKGEARRREIVETAFDLYKRLGYSQASVRAIGRELGVQPAHILYYFPTREHLLQEVVLHWDLLQRAAAKNAGRIDGNYTLDDYAAAIRANLAQPGLIHMYLSFALEAAAPDHQAHEFYRARNARTEGLLARAVEIEIQERRMPPDRDPHLVARLLIAAADGLQLQAFTDPKIDAPGDLDRIIDDLRYPQFRLLAAGGNKENTDA